jgi:hypothetical protein
MPLTLPSIPQHIQLGGIKLPINFITINVQDILGKNIAGATVSFIKKEPGIKTEEKSAFEPQTVSSFDYASVDFPGIETTEGMYASPELPDGDYSILIRTDGVRD